MALTAVATTAVAMEADVPPRALGIMAEATAVDAPQAVAVMVEVAMVVDAPPAVAAIMVAAGTPHRAAVEAILLRVTAVEDSRTVDPIVEGKG